MWSAKPKIFIIILWNKLTDLKVASFLSNLFQAQCDIIKDFILSFT